MLLCCTATDGRRLYSCSVVQPRTFLICPRELTGRRLVPFVLLVEDFPRQHGRVDDRADDGRRPADVAVVPRERRPRRAHPVQAAQQVLVAPRVQVIICIAKGNEQSQRPGEVIQSARTLRRGGDTCPPEHPLVRRLSIWVMQSWTRAGAATVPCRKGGDATGQRRG